MTLPYRAYPFFRNGHVQTFFAGMDGKDDGDVPMRAILIALEENEQIVVHEELEPAVADDTARLVLLIHGLGGDHTSPYMRRIAEKLRAQRLRIWRMDMRGSGDGAALAWRPAHAGRSDDLAAVVAKARELYPQARVSIVGISLGANVLLKFLGELSAGKHSLSLEASGVQQAIAVVPPLDLHECVDNMDRLRRRIYNIYYVNALMQQAIEKRRLWPQWKAISTQPRIKTIRQYDARYTAPLSGFRDENDYYTQASSLPWLPEIKVPTEIILDRHDPIVTWHSCQKAQFDPKWVGFTHTDYGGHVGFIGTDQRGKPFRWLNYYVAEKIKTF